METWNHEPGVIELPDGRRIRGTGMRKTRGVAPEPNLAVYLLSRDPGERRWPYRWVRWRDFSVPRNSEHAMAALLEAFERAPFERVEIACGGGIGRTGTALALLAAFGGVPAESAVDWVRARYHRRSVETPAQRRWVMEASAALGLGCRSER